MSQHYITHPSSCTHPGNTILTLTNNDKLISYRLISWDSLLTNFQGPTQNNSNHVSSLKLECNVQPALLLLINASLSSKLWGRRLKREEDDTAAPDKRETVSEGAATQHSSIASSELCTFIGMRYAQDGHILRCNCRARRFLIHPYIWHSYLATVR